MYDNELKHVTA